MDCAFAATAYYRRGLDIKTLAQGMILHWVLLTLDMPLVQFVPVESVNNQANIDIFISTKGTL